MSVQLSLTECSHSRRVQSRAHVIWSINPPPRLCQALSGAEGTTYSALSDVSLNVQDARLCIHHVLNVVR